MTQLVLVDKKDNVIGFKEKFATHKLPVPLHRAISIVIFNKGGSEMLLTKRAKNKPTWPGFWTNAVCTHPYPNETYQAAADRRIYEELGFKTPLKKAMSFIYDAKMDDGVWGEHELDHVFIGNYEGKIIPNIEEIAGYEWLGVPELKKEIKDNPNKYSPWFKIILEKLKI